ncbi:hypothetical protein [Nitrospira sp. Nam80]
MSSLRSRIDSTTTGTGQHVLASVAQYLPPRGCAGASYNQHRSPEATRIGRGKQFTRPQKAIPPPSFGPSFEAKDETIGARSWTGRPGGRSRRPDQGYRKYGRSLGIATRHTTTLMCLPSCHKSDRKSSIRRIVHSSFFSPSFASHPRGIDEN